MSSLNVPRSFYGKLVDGKVVPATGEEISRVGFIEKDGVTVSTVFLGIDHNVGGERPLWFETMIFRGSWDGEYQERYETLEEAKAGHERAVLIAFGEKP